MKLQNLDNITKIPRYIFWIDEDIKNETNQIYLNYLKKEFSKFNKIETFT